MSWSTYSSSSHQCEGTPGFKTRWRQKHFLQINNYIFEKKRKAKERPSNHTRWDSQTRPPGSLCIKNVYLEKNEEGIRRARKKEGERARERERVFIAEQSRATFYFLIVVSDMGLNTGKGWQPVWKP